MALTPSQLGRRYAPFVVVVAVQALLVAIVPSKAPPRSTVAASAGTARGAGGGDASTSDTGDATGTSAAGPDVGGGPAGGVDNAATGTDGATSGAGTTSANGAAGRTGSAAARPAGPVDRSHCNASGYQVGVTFYMPKCEPVWHGGDNGGSTMTGVSATEIRYLFYATKSDPQVNAILATQGLAASKHDQCAAWASFDKAINKRWEFYGRKAVALDGPGSHKGSTVGGCDAHYPHYQGQCALTPPDPPCLRAEAAQIAAMKPAFVLVPVSPHPALHNELGKRHIMVLGGQWQPARYHVDVAPYHWDPFRDGELAARMMAEYWCKKLAGKPVRYAGPDVMGVNPPLRKAGVSFPATDGDPTYKIGVDIFARLITGGMCGSSKDAPLLRPYNSDITTAQQQSQTSATAYKRAGVTTVICFCDPIAPVFQTAAMDQQGYHPEHLIAGVGLIDYDVLGRLYSPTQWNHAFGLSELFNFPTYDQTDQSRAWRDAGNAGTPDATEGLPWAYFNLLASAVQLAGPNITPATIKNGLFSAQGLGGEPGHPLIKFGARADDYTGVEDAREVWWSATARSNVDGKPGAYVPVNGGRRYQSGQIPSGDPKVFQ